MPISVLCPSCSAAFNVRDEFAGKRGKCPKCGNALAIPVSAPTPPEPEPQFQFDDEPEDKPVPDKVPPRIAADELADDGPPRRKREPMSEADDRPRPKRPAMSDSEDDDRPRSKRRSGNDDADRDDDRPKKKGKSGMLLLGILGGLFVLCAGGCGGLYFFVVKPIIDKGNEIVSEAKQSVVNDRVTPEKAKSIRAGMTAAEVEAVLGKGKPAAGYEITNMVGLKKDDQEETDARWQPKVTAGAVTLWQNLPDRIAVAFSMPGQGGKVVGVLGEFHPATEMGETTESVALPAAAKPEPKEPSTPATKIAPNKPPGGKENKTSNLGGTASAMLAIAPKNVGKWIRVRGSIARIIPPEDDRPAVLELEVKPGSGLYCELDAGFWKPDTFRAGEPVQLVGKVAEGAQPSNVRLLRCDVVATGPETPPVVPPVVAPERVDFEVTAEDLVKEALDDGKAAVQKYAAKTIRVTGTIVKLPPGGPGGPGGIVQLSGPDGDPKTGVYGRFNADARAGLADLKVGDTVSFIGGVSVFGEGDKRTLFANAGEVKSVFLFRCRIVK